MNHTVILDQSGAAAAAAGLPDLVLSVPGLRCAACLSKVERTLGALPGVRHARGNMTRKRVRIEGTVAAEAAIAALQAAGYPARLLDPVDLKRDAADPHGRWLLTCLAIAGFAMMNVMLLSVAIWSGASDATREMFHWLSAAIALPAVAISAQPFLRSAASALAGRRLNMDVPISLAIVLAAAMSLYETAMGGRHAWFDAALSLTFFLLAGRYLEHLTRRAARSAAAELTALESHSALRVEEGGRCERVHVSELVVGDRIRLLPGDRLAVDGRLREGHAHIDRSLVTGESIPVRVSAGDRLAAGEIVLDGRVDVEVTSTGADTSLRRIAALVELAESARNRYTALADRAAGIYAPAVHLLALFGFVGWILATGDVRLSLNVAVAVLIITCPCALGLAVPAVATAAAGRLFRAGYLLRHETALERLAEIDTVVFDKTGTLTMGSTVSGFDELSDDEAAALAALAGSSSHPVAAALAGALPDTAEHDTAARLELVREVAGCGVEGICNGVMARLGRGGWIGSDSGGTVFQLGDGPYHPLSVAETLRPGAVEAVQAFRRAGYSVQLLSGDRPEATRAIAARLGIDEVAAAVRPEGKIAHVEALAAAGRRVLMVGDGLNDTAALAAAHASIAPASALDASRAAADVVLLRDDLASLPRAVVIARSARARMRENFAIAAAYNLVAIPLALAGYATPLLAALAMSASSITVVLNAMRVHLK